jgi:hypothetical protein
MPPHPDAATDLIVTSISHLEAIMAQRPRRRVEGLPSLPRRLPDTIILATIVSIVVKTEFFAPFPRKRSR